jgi:hypothetical protein
MRSLICTIALVLAFHSIQASHIMGANISYRCLGGDQYEVSLYVFQNCADPQNTSSEIIRTIPSCDFSFSSHSLSLVDILEVTQASPIDMENSACNGGFLPGVVRLTYTDTITINTACPEMVIYWKKCNRSFAVNIDNSDSPCFYVESVLKTSSGCNNSPQLSSPTAPYVCGDPNINVNLGAFDPDGDQLRYSLVPAQRPTSGNSHTNLVYEDGFSGDLPIQGMTIDPNTGNMSLETDIIGYYIVAILVEELDASLQVKGSMLIDVQFVVSSCTPFPPYMANPGVSLTSAIASNLTSNMGVAVCDGSSFCMDMIFQSDDLEDTLNVSANVDEVLPGATMTMSGLNPVEVQLCWTAQNMTSDRLLIISVGNDDEPIPTVVSYSLPIINANDDVVNIEEDLISICGLSIELDRPYDYGQWSGDATLVIQDLNSQISQIQFPESGAYELVWNSGCTSDTISVTAYLEPLAEAGSDDLNCDASGYSLLASPFDSASEGLWTASDENPAEVIFENENEANTLVTMPEPGAYRFYWTVTNAVCEMMDSVLIENGMLVPVILFENDIFILEDLNPSLSYQWFRDGIAILGAFGTSYVPEAEAYGEYQVISSHPNGCEAESEVYTYAVSSLSEYDLVQMKIQPNPMQNQAIISWASSKENVIRAEIRSIQGVLIHTELVRGNSLELVRGPLHSGVYLISLIDADGRIIGVHRFMIE